jgi:hypothetical protein
MKKTTSVSLLVVDERRPEYEPYLASVVRWAQGKTIRLVRSAGYREAIDLCSSSTNGDFDIVVGGLTSDNLPFDFIDVLEAKRPASVPVLLNHRTRSLLHIDRPTRLPVEAPLSGESLVRLLDSLVNGRPETPARPEPTSLRVGIATHSIRCDRSDVVSENTVALVADVSRERQLVFLGDLNDGHDHSGIVRNYLMDHLREAIAMTGDDPTASDLERIVRSVHSDLAVLRYLDYHVDIAMAIALVDTSAGTVGIVDRGGEPPVLVNPDGEILSIPVDRYRSVPLHPGTALFFHTRRFFPPVADSDILKQKFFRRLARSSYSRNRIDADLDVAGTLIGVVVEND